MTEGEMSVGCIKVGRLLLATSEATDVIATENWV